MFLNRIFGSLLSWFELALGLSFLIFTSQLLPTGRKLPLVPVLDNKIDQAVSLKAVLGSRPEVFDDKKSFALSLLQGEVELNDDDIAKRLESLYWSNQQDLYNQLISFTDIKSRKLCLLRAINTRYPSGWALLNFFKDCLSEELILREFESEILQKRQLVKLVSAQGLLKSLSDRRFDMLKRLRFLFESSESFISCD